MAIHNAMSKFWLSFCQPVLLASLTRKDRFSIMKIVFYPTTHYGC